MVRPFLGDPELSKALHDKSPWPELGIAEDVAKAAVYLSTTDARLPPGPCSPSTVASPRPNRRIVMAGLQDKAVVITRASSGFGRGIAKACAAEGAKVVVSDVHENPSTSGFEDDPHRPPCRPSRKPAAPSPTSAATSQGRPCGRESWSGNTPAPEAVL